MTANIPVRKAMAHGAAMVVRTLRAAVAALRVSATGVPTLSAAVAAKRVLTLFRGSRSTGRNCDPPLHASPATAGVP